MTTDWEVTQEGCRLAAPLSPLPTIDGSEDNPPLTHAVDELDIEPNQALPDGTDDWGIYRGDEQERDKANDEPYYSGNAEESPIESTFERDHQLLQRPAIDIDRSNQYNTPTITIIHLNEEITKLSLALRQQIRLNQRKGCQIASLQSQLYFEEMLSTHQKTMIRRLRCRCDDLAYAKEHAKVYHENIDTFNKCNETILNHAGYLDTDNFCE
jgi:hypothetical protein